MTWGRTSRHARGYGTEWDKLRLEVLRRDYGLCQCNRCQGGKARITFATEVHHVVSKAEAKRRGWTQQQVDHPSNLIAINTECHKRVTIEEQGGKVRPTIGLDGFPIGG